jgi:hypothetical protein
MMGIEMNPVKPVSTVASNSRAEFGKAPAISNFITGLPDLPVEPIVIAMLCIANPEGSGRSHPY